MYSDKQLTKIERRVFCFAFWDSYAYARKPRPENNITPSVSSNFLLGNKIIEAAHVGPGVVNSVPSVSLTLLIQ